MRDDLNVFSPEVEKFVFKPGDSESSRIISLKEDLVSKLKPLEMRVSKSKEKGKGFSRFMVFSSQNLRLYNTVDEYLDDIKELQSNSVLIDKRIEKIQKLSGINSNLIQKQPDELIEFNEPANDDNLTWSDDAF